MALTRVDCFFYRGRNATLGGSSYVALNPHAQPGSFVVAGASGARESLGSQVATKLALEHFVEGVLQYMDMKSGLGDFDELQSEGTLAAQVQNVSQAALEAAFRNANTAVYSFAHKLAAGGRLSTSLTGVVVEGDFISAGRVGTGGAYLCRGGDVFPFFETIPEQVRVEFLGTNSLISVELASVPSEESDILFATSAALSLTAERELASLSLECRKAFENRDRVTRASGERFRLGQGNPCALLAEALYDDADDLEFAMLALVGPQTIYLDEPYSPKRG